MSGHVSNYQSKASENHPSTVFVNTIKSTYLHQHINFPTHFRGKQTANILDLILTNEENIIEEIRSTEPIGNSHHITIMCNIRCYKDEEMNENKATFKWETGDYTSFNQYIEEINWEEELQSTIDQDWQKFTEIIQNGINNFIPKKKHPTNKKPKPLWMTNENFQKVKKKHQTWNKYKRTRNDEDYKLYCRARNQERKAARQAIKAFEKNIAKNIKSNPKSFHKYVQSRTKVKTGVSDLEVNGKNISTDSQKAEALNNFFVSVFTKEDNSETPTCAPCIPENKLTSTEITRDRVEKRLKETKVNKSPGPDGIHPKMLKELATTISKPLTMIFKKRNTTKGLERRKYHTTVQKRKQKRRGQL